MPDRSTSIMARTAPPDVAAPEINPNEKLTVSELCAELKVSRSTFYDWRQKRRGPRCIRLPNGGLRVRRRDLDAWLATQEVA
jgi:excisionase family DNA binding protein